MKPEIQLQGHSTVKTRKRLRGMPPKKRIFVCFLKYLIYTQSYRIFVVVNQLKPYVMARPIKETPVLYGKDAIRMLKEVENVVPLSPERTERLKQARITLKKIWKKSDKEGYKI
jgi:hypothetical protein